MLSRRPGPSTADGDVAPGPDGPPPTVLSRRARIVHRRRRLPAVRPYLSVLARANGQCRHADLRTEATRRTAALAPTLSGFQGTRAALSGIWFIIRGPRRRLSTVGSAPDL